MLSSSSSSQPQPAPQGNVDDFDNVVVTLTDPTTDNNNNNIVQEEEDEEVVEDDNVGSTLNMSALLSLTPARQPLTIEDIDARQSSGAPSVSVGGGASTTELNTTVTPPTHRTSETTQTTSRVHMVDVRASSAPSDIGSPAKSPTSGSGSEDTQQQQQQPPRRTITTPSSPTRAHTDTKPTAAAASKANDKNSHDHSASVSPPAVSRPASIQLAIQSRLNSLAQVPMNARETSVNSGHGSGNGGGGGGAGRRPIPTLVRTTPSSKATQEKNDGGCCGRLHAQVYKSVRWLTQPVRRLWYALSYRERVLLIVLLHNISICMDVYFSYTLSSSSSDNHQYYFYVTLVILFIAFLPWLGLILPCFFYPLAWCALRVLNACTFVLNPLVKCVSCGYRNPQWAVDTFPGTYDIGALCAMYPGLSLVCGVPSFYCCGDAGLCECFPGLDGIEQVYHQRYYTVYRRTFYQDIPQMVFILVYMCMEDDEPWYLWLSLGVKCVHICYFYISRPTLRRDYLTAQQLTDGSEKLWRFNERICTLFTMCGLTRQWNAADESATMVGNLTRSRPTTQASPRNSV